MSEPQEYELKLAVNHHNSLKTQQLIEFLQTESNQFLVNYLSSSLTQDKFVTIFESICGAQSEDYSEYVGLILLYSSSSLQSYEYMKAGIPDRQLLSDMFIIIVEMQSAERKTSVIGDEGNKFCQRNGYQFITLSLQNSEQLVSVLQKNLYELIENYYYPNEEEKAKGQNHSEYVFDYGDSAEKGPEGADSHERLAERVAQKSEPKLSPTKSPLSTRKIIASKEQKKLMEKLLQKANILRQSRTAQVFQEQRQIDESIANVQRVLMNINRNIDMKLKSNWYTSLNHTLYSPLEKNSTSYCKIKLTQEFLDDSEQAKQFPAGRGGRSSRGQSRVSPGQPDKMVLVNKFIAKYRKLEPIIKLLLTVTESVIVELDVYQSSSMEELAAIACKKLAITETEHNLALMTRIISQRIEGFVKELKKAVLITQKIRIDERSYLKPEQPPRIPANSASRNLVKSNFSSNSFHN